MLKQSHNSLCIVKLKILQRKFKNQELFNTSFNDTLYDVQSINAELNSINANLNIYLFYKSKSGKTYDCCIGSFTHIFTLQLKVNSGDAISSYLPWLNAVFY